MQMEQGTITRRMDAVLHGLADEFSSLCSRRDFESKLRALQKAWNTSGRPSRLRELFDLFDLCKIPYDRGKDVSYYEELVTKSDIPGIFEIEDKMVYELYTRYEKYPSPKICMRRMVDRLSSKEDHWENDTLRVRILKQFIKYGNYLSDAGYGGRQVIRKYVCEKTGTKPSEETVWNTVDDGVFAGLETADKAQKKPSGKYGLLKTADDLAGGKFRAEGATKKSLYLFAMVYGMTYYSGKEDEILDAQTDIETNLFRDYYANNLMRFLSKAYKENLSEFEIDPSGQGINYKNFAEMVYLYYISRDCSPQDKIRLSADMIKKIQDTQFQKGKPSLHQSGRTAYYRKLTCGGNHFAEDLLSLPETEFKNFLCENYDCDTSVVHAAKKGMQNGKIGVFQLETEQMTAFQAYEDILTDLIKQLKEQEGTTAAVSYDFSKLTDEEKQAEREKWLVKCNYGLWFTDPAAFRKKGLKNICDRKPEINREKFCEFMDFICEINSFMGYTADEDISAKNEKQEWTEISKKKTKALFVSSPKAVTRTSMIVAYYYYYNALHENDQDDKLKSFGELFNSFKKDLDPKLEKAGYQELSGKNIFDVLTAFSSYAYINT